MSLLRIGWEVAGKRRRVALDQQVHRWRRLGESITGAVVAGSSKRRSPRRVVARQDSGPPPRPRQVKPDALVHVECGAHRDAKQ